ncbi:MAG: 16S rRNA (cytosine(1402)-N(4))-methyltransferase RsmH [Cytophagales bacterium]|nr:MAG: 16S rRNA (cytosine(1402)-N(4))-methyltransferase RsmH [Cytophagales bacterium]
MMSYHIPVMLDECVSGLNLREDGIYVDVTFGGGGHTKEILKHLDSSKGKIYSFDQDEDAKKNAESINHTSFRFIDANFRFLKRYLKAEGIQKVDGILADLGISSYQIDTPERGFSTRFEGPLDMRMDKMGDKTAQTILNAYTEQDLHKILGMYGEIRNAKTLASEIVKSRINNKFQTIDQLKNILKRLSPPREENKYMAQVFQALRIEVNDELKALEELLIQSSELLNEGGRLVIMSYHSLEDRLVKNFFTKGKFSGELDKDLFGNVSKPFEQLTRKPIEASQEELERNKRARSAKLRIAEKLFYKQ